jgi:hypothetical protein
MKMSPSAGARLYSASYSISGAKHRKSMFDDVIYGAIGIANFLFGDSKKKRKVYYLVDKYELPVFRMGTGICARKSTLEAWMAAQEASSIKGSV